MATKKKTAVKKPAPKKVTPVVRKSNDQRMVVDFSDESKALIEKLIDALKKPTIQSSDAVVHEQAAPEEKSDNKISLTQIRETINEKAGQGKTASIVKLLDGYGAQSASTLSEDNYSAFFTDLKEL